MPSKRKITTEANNATTTTTAAAAAAANPNAAAPAKRQRVSRACDQCRAAREKCDGIQPLCFPCVSQNRPCTYAANPKKRGVQTGYIKTLEVALAWLFEKVPGCEEALENLLMHEGGQGQDLLVAKESDKANRLHKRWRRSRTHREIDRILSGGDVSQQRVDESSPSDDGDSETEQGEKTPGTIRGLTPTRASLSAFTPTNGHEPSFSTPQKIKLPSNHWRLLDIYLSYTHCWFPILEKQYLLKTVYLYPNEGLDIQRLDLGSAAHAELWAALALASYQDASSSKPSTTGPPAGANSSSDDIYNIARRLVPSEEGDFEIQHARALLLLALVNIGKGRKTCAWILVGLAYRIALDVSEVHAGDERSSRGATAVLMGCYILDTLISVHRRGMPSLETTGISEGMSIPEDNLDEWQPWAPCDGFGQGSVGPANLSRSPAYSLTTFNQLYDVFKFLRKTSLQRQKGLLPLGHHSEVMMLLHQTIKPRLPFGNFIVARDSSSVPIPSAYVLRILFLWVSTLLEYTDESPCVLILESIEQFLSHFGACGAPPFLATCLAMMSQHPSFRDLDIQSRDRWQAVKDRLTSIWTCTTSKSSGMGRPTSAISKPTGISDMSMTSSSIPSTRLSATTPSDFYPTNNLQTPTLAPKQRPYPANNAQFMLGTFSPSKPMLGQGIDPSAAAATTTMNMLDTQSIMHGGPAPPLGHAQNMPGVRGAVHRESFNGGPLDYDALLDDLSSMDYIDRVDADPQFMANLGFAPGCDMTEILSRGFKAI